MNIEIISLVDVRLGFKIQFTSPLQGMWTTTTTSCDQNKGVEFEEFNETTAEEVAQTVTSGKQAHLF
jgi:hypothetical protein